MSLVEIALKKMQARSAHDSPREPSSDASAGQPRAASRLGRGVVGELVDVTSHRDSQALANVPRHRTDKLIRIDRHALRSEGLLPPEHQERALADEYRQIKRPLIAQAFGRGREKAPNGQLIMMASAMPGEGKTFTSINLALSIALEKDVSVLLVDADVAKPHVSQTFGVADEPGLLDLLRDEALGLESSIVPTDVPGLCILPAGRRSDTATEFLASQRMGQIAQNIASQDESRIVLIDSSPLLLTSESRALAQSVGHVVIVVRAGFTPQQAVLDAIAHLGEEKAISLILNQSVLPSTSSYYYGYGETVSS